MTAGRCRSGDLRWSVRSLAVAGAALALAVSCAPRPTLVVPLDGGARGARYLAGVLERERGAGLVEASVMLWARTRAGVPGPAGPVRDASALRPLPAVQVDLRLGWPDAFRVRLAPVFGVALDVAVRGDSLVAFAPAQRSGLALDAVRDSLGVEAPGRLLVRLWSATWRPPPEAWTAAGWDGDLLLARWEESGDSLAVAVDGNGRPAWARMARPDGRGARATYGRWERVDGVAWPVLLRLDALDGSFMLTSRMDHLRLGARQDSSRFVLQLPAGTRRLELARLGLLLDVLGSAR